MLVVGFSTQLVVLIEHEVGAVQKNAAIVFVETGVHPVTVHPLAVAIAGLSAAVPQFPVTVKVCAETVGRAV